MQNPGRVAMEYRQLGATGVRVSPLCLGAMMLGSFGNADPDGCARLIHRALDAGVNFIDTADIYSSGESEEMIGRALAGGRRDTVVLATKFALPMSQDPNERGSSRRWIFRAVEDSLRRLRTDWIDLYQVHRWDPETDHAETLGALTDLVRQGKVRYIGTSTYPAARVVEAQWMARERGLERYITEQPPYSLLVRGVEADLLPVCAELGMGVLTWAPLAGGWLSGRHLSKGGNGPSRSSWQALSGSGGPAVGWEPTGTLPQRYDMSSPANRLKLEAVQTLGRLAEESGVTLAQFAVAFILNHPAVTAAIIGPRTVDQLESLLPAADVRLDPAVLDRIDEIVPPGHNVDPADAGWRNPALSPAALRRCARAAPQ